MKRIVLDDMVWEFWFLFEIVCIFSCFNGVLFYKIKNDVSVNECIMYY